MIFVCDTLPPTATAADAVAVAIDDDASDGLQVKWNISQLNKLNREIIVGPCRFSLFVRNTIRTHSGCQCKGLCVCVCVRVLYLNATSFLRHRKLVISCFSISVDAS